MPKDTSFPSPDSTPEEPLCRDDAVLQDSAYWDIVNERREALKNLIEESTIALENVFDVNLTIAPDGTKGLQYRAENQSARSEALINDALSKAIRDSQPSHRSNTFRLPYAPWKIFDDTTTSETLFSYSPSSIPPEQRRGPDGELTLLPPEINEKSLNNMLAIFGNPEGFAAYNALHKEAGEACEIIKEMKNNLMHSNDEDHKSTCRAIAREESINRQVQTLIAEDYGFSGNRTLSEALEGVCMGEHMDYSLLLLPEAPPPSPTPRGDSSGRGVTIKASQEGGLAINFTRPYAPEAVRNVFGDYNTAHPENPVEMPKDLSGNAGTINIAAAPGSMGELQAFLNEKLVGAMPLAASAKVHAR
ncbi:MAG: hypothetical protein SFW64_02735 [Alphaproteobacteria bacterium]|nr:hypothetical protein [Alphaproteobacteria bacterium]